MNESQTSTDSEVEDLKLAGAGLPVPNDRHTASLCATRSWRTVAMLMVVACVMMAAPLLVYMQVGGRACDCGGDLAEQEENLSSPDDISSIVNERALVEQKLLNRMSYHLLDYPGPKEGGIHEKMMYNGVEILLPVADCVPALLYGVESFYVPQEWSNLLVMRTTTCVCDRGVANFTVFPFADYDDAYTDRFMQWYAETTEPLPMDGKVVCGPVPRLGDFA